MKVVAREMGFTEYDYFISDEIFIHREIEKKLHSLLREKIAKGKAYKRECFYISFKKAVSIVKRMVADNTEMSNVKSELFSQRMDELSREMFPYKNNNNPDKVKELSNLFFKCEALIEELEIDNVKTELEAISSDELAMTKVYCSLLEAISLKKDAYLDDFVSIINQYKEISEKLMKAIK